MENQETVKFNVETERADPKKIILSVYQALSEKGYNPINQIVGYILSGDPSYITSYNGARSLVRKLERLSLIHISEPTRH